MERFDSTTVAGRPTILGWTRTTDPLDAIDQLQRGLDQSKRRPFCVTLFVTEFSFLAFSYRTDDLLQRIGTTTDWFVGNFPPKNTNR